MLVTDRRLVSGTDELVESVGAAVSSGANAVQLREKDLPASELLALALQLRKVTSGRALLIINSSLNVALACDADGMHLPEALPMVERPSRGFVIGRSVHSVEAARRAQSGGVDYLIAGPVYGTPSHPDSLPKGRELIESIAHAVTKPVIAIGGIGAENVADLLHSGACGVAVISAILGAPSAERAAQELRATLDTAWQIREATIR